MVTACDSGYIPWSSHGRFLGASVWLWLQHEQFGYSLCMEKRTVTCSSLAQIHQLGHVLSKAAAVQPPEEAKAKSQSGVFSSLQSWPGLVWQDRAEPQAKSVLEKSFRAICGIDRSHMSPRAEAALGELPTWTCLSTALRAGEAAGTVCVYVCTQLCFCSPFRVPCLPGAFEFPRRKGASCQP